MRKVSFLPIFFFNFNSKNRPLSSSLLVTLPPPRQTCMSLCVLSSTITELSIASSAIHSYLFEVRKFPSFNLLVFKSILEDKIRIHARAYNILYFSCFSYVFTFVSSYLLPLIIFASSHATEIYLPSKLYWFLKAQLEQFVAFDYICFF